MSNEKPTETRPLILNDFKSKFSRFVGKQTKNAIAATKEHSMSRGSNLM